MKHGGRASLLAPISFARKSRARLCACLHPSLHRRAALAVGFVLAVLGALVAVGVAVHRAETEAAHEAFIDYARSLTRSFLANLEYERNDLTSAGQWLESFPPVSSWRSVNLTRLNTMKTSYSPTGIHRLVWAVWVNGSTLEAYNERLRNEWGVSGAWNASSGADVTVRDPSDLFLVATIDSPRLLPTPNTICPPLLGADALTIPVVRSELPHLLTTTEAIFIQPINTRCTTRSSAVTSNTTASEPAISTIIMMMPTSLADAHPNSFPDGVLSLTVDINQFSLEWIETVGAIGQDPIWWVEDVGHAHGLEAPAPFRSNDRSTIRVLSEGTRVGTGALVVGGVFEGARLTPIANADLARQFAAAAPAQVAHMESSIGGRIWRTHTLIPGDLINEFGEGKTLLMAVVGSLAVVLLACFLAFLFAVKHQTRVRLEAVRIQALMQLEAARKAHETTVNYACHELRNPLQVVLATVDELIEKTAQLEDAAHDASAATGHVVLRNDFSAQLSSRVGGAGAEDPGLITSTASVDHEAALPRAQSIRPLLSHLRSTLEHFQQARSDLESVRSSADAIQRIVTDLADLSRLQAGDLAIEPHVLALRPFLSYVVTSFISLSQVPIRLLVAMDVPPLLVGDALRLFQVLSHGMDAACKFTTTGHITILVTLDRTTHPRHDSDLVSDPCESASPEGKAADPRILPPFANTGSRTTPTDPVSAHGARCSSGCGCFPAVCGCTKGPRAPPSPPASSLSGGSTLLETGSAGSGASVTMLSRDPAVVSASAVASVSAGGPLQSPPALGAVHSVRGMVVPSPETHPRSAAPAIPAAYVGLHVDVPPNLSIDMVSHNGSRFGDRGRGDQSGNASPIVPLGNADPRSWNPFFACLHTEMSHAVLTTPARPATLLVGEDLGSFVDTTVAGDEAALLRSHLKDPSGTLLGSSSPTSPTPFSITRPSSSPSTSTVRGSLRSTSPLMNAATTRLPGLLFRIIDSGVSMHGVNEADMLDPLTRDARERRGDPVPTTTTGSVPSHPPLSRDRSRSSALNADMAAFEPEFAHLQATTSSAGFTLTGQFAVTADAAMHRDPLARRGTPLPSSTAAGGSPPSGSSARNRAREEASGEALGSLDEASARPREEAPIPHASSAPEFSASQFPRARAASDPRRGRAHSSSRGEKVGEQSSGRRGSGAGQEGASVVASNASHLAAGTSPWGFDLDRPYAVVAFPAASGTSGSKSPPLQAHRSPMLGGSSTSAPRLHLSERHEAGTSPPSLATTLSGFTGAGGMFTTPAPSSTSQPAGSSFLEARELAEAGTVHFGSTTPFALTGSTTRTGPALPTSLPPLGLPATTGVVEGAPQRSLSVDIHGLSSVGLPLASSGSMAVVPPGPGSGALSQAWYSTMRAPLTPLVEESANTLPAGHPSDDGVSPSRTASAWAGAASVSAASEGNSGLPSSERGVAGSSSTHPHRTTVVGGAHDLAVAGSPQHDADSLHDAPVAPLTRRNLSRGRDADTLQPDVSRSPPAESAGSSSVQAPTSTAGTNAAVHHNASVPASAEPVATGDAAVHVARDSLADISASGQLNSTVFPPVSSSSSRKGLTAAAAAGAAGAVLPTGSEASSRGTATPVEADGRQPEAREPTAPDADDDEEDAALPRRARVLGSGLGLLHAQRVAKAMGGRVEISSPGDGSLTVFQLRLPVQPPATAWSVIPMRARRAVLDELTDTLVNLHILPRTAGSRTGHAPSAGMRHGGTSVGSDALGSGISGPISGFGMQQSAAASPTHGVSASEVGTFVPVPGPVLAAGAPPAIRVPLPARGPGTPAIRPLQVFGNGHELPEEFDGGGTRISVRPLFAERSGVLPGLPRRNPTHQTRTAPFTVTGVAPWPAQVVSEGEVVGEETDEEDRPGRDGNHRSEAVRAYHRGVSGINDRTDEDAGAFLNLRAMHRLSVPDAGARDLASPSRRTPSGPYRPGVWGSPTVPLALDGVHSGTDDGSAHGRSLTPLRSTVGSGSRHGLSHGASTHGARLTELNVFVDGPPPGMEAPNRSDTEQSIHSSMGHLTSTDSLGRPTREGAEPPPLRSWRHHTASGAVRTAEATGTEDRGPVQRDVTADTNAPAIPEGVVRDFSIAPGVESARSMSPTHEIVTHAHAKRYDGGLPPLVSTVRSVGGGGTVPSPPAMPGRVDTAASRGLGRPDDSTGALPLAAGAPSHGALLPTGHLVRGGSDGAVILHLLPLVTTTTTATTTTATTTTATTTATTTVEGGVHPSGSDSAQDQAGRTRHVASTGAGAASVGGAVGDVRSDASGQVDGAARLRLHGAAATLAAIASRPTSTGSERHLREVLLGLSDHAPSGGDFVSPPVAGVPATVVLSPVPSAFGTSAVSGAAVLRPPGQATGRVPRSRRPREAGASASLLAGAPLQGLNLHVLVVDDDASILLLMQRLLKQLHCTSETLPDGADVERCLRRRGQLPRAHHTLKGRRALANRGESTAEGSHTSLTDSRDAHSSTVDLTAGAGGSQEFHPGGGKGAAGTPETDRAAAHSSGSHPSPGSGSPPRFDAVLMDIVMVRSDGAEVTERLVRTLGLTIPVIAMTANTNPWDLERYKRAGFTAVLAKPFRKDDLSAALTVHVVPRKIAMLPRLAEVTSVDGSGHASSGIGGSGWGEGKGVGGGGGEEGRGGGGGGSGGGGGGRM